MAKIQIKKYGATYPYGRQTIGTIKPSTGIYGKHVGGQFPNRGVRVRKGR